MSQAFLSQYQHLNRSGSTLYMPRLDKSDLFSFLAQKRHDQAIQLREKHPFLCSALGAQAWQNSLPPNELSLYDYLVNF